MNSLSEDPFQPVPAFSPPGSPVFDGPLKEIENILSSTLLANNNHIQSVPLDVSPGKTMKLEFVKK